MLTYEFVRTSSLARACGFGGGEAARHYCCRGNRTAPECWGGLRGVQPGLEPPLHPELCCEPFATLVRQGGRPTDVEVLPAPSAARPVVFLHDPRTGGTSFEQALYKSCRRRGALTLVSSAGYGVAGTPFFAKFYRRRTRRSAACVGGHFDYDMISTDVLGCEERQCTCVLTLRHPVRRFLSYYAKRSSRPLGSSWANLTIGALEWLLRASSPAALSAFDEESVACSKSVGLCFRRPRNLTRPGRWRNRNLTRLLGEQYAAQGGPLGSLKRVLAPDTSDVRVAARRIERCIPLPLTERFDDTTTVVDHFLPFMRGSLARQPPIFPTDAGELERQVARRPDLVAAIERHVGSDAGLYAAGMARFERLLRVAREARGERNASGRGPA